MLASELGNLFLRHSEYMKYATSQKALQRLEQEYLARLAPSHSDKVSYCAEQVHHSGNERSRTHQGGAFIRIARTIDLVVPGESLTR